ncbi:MAG: methyltransferase domain-containing protein, partial [Candidatus Hydrogenedentales bacterium]
FALTMGDAARLPFARASFDVVCCVDAFEHFPDPAAATREFRRVLRPGGFMFLSAPNYGNIAGIVKWWYERFGRYERDTWAPFGRWQRQEHETLVTARRIRRWFSEAGFNGTRRIGFGREVGLGLFPWVDHPRMPDAIRFRLQTAATGAGPLVAKAFPGASLHNFWRFDCPSDA